MTHGMQQPCKAGSQRLPGSRVLLPSSVEACKMSHNIWHSGKALNDAAGKAGVAMIEQACQALQTSSPVSNNF